MTDWLFAGALLVLFVYVGTLNWLCAIQGLRGRTTSSWIPLLGGGAGAAGCLAAPGGVLADLWWVPLVLDFGTVPGLAWTAVDALRRRGA